MPRSLILKSLEIHGFRAFCDLRIERLGRVNLITGKNNVGKTCLLEALRLYALRGDPRLILPLLEARDEVGVLPLDESMESVETWLRAIRYLFYGRRDIKERLVPIQIGPVDRPSDRFSMSMVWYSEQTSEEGRRILQRLESEDRGTIKEQIPGVHIQFGKQDFAYPLESLRSRVRYVRLPAEFREVPCYFVPANGLDKRQIGQLWDNIALTSLEEDVLAALRIIAPKAERVNLVGATERVRERVPILKAIGIEEPIPLRNLGEGMNRLFGVTLALVNAKDGLLLVDEIESGLHYSVQPDLWRLVFQAARQLNVQVFATTHSWDCIKGFQKAAKEDKQAEGLLISLREKGEGQVAAVLFDEHELAVAAREQIEVR